jgi:uncharacterized membrane protein YdjX (TVP38/TMEM64 family)
MAKRNRRKAVLARIKVIALVILLGSGLLLGLQHPQLDLFSPEGFKRAVDQAGFLGPLVYMGLLTLSVVISPLPSAPLAMVAGAIWGSVLAGVYSVIGGFLGGLIAYFIGYSWGRSAVKALTGKAIYFSARRGEVFLGWMIFVTRLLPILSFDLISYGAGITGLSFPIYAVATLLGMIPSTFLLTYLGSTFTVGLPLGVALSAIFVVVLIGLPWAAQRYNWFGLRDVIRIE